MPSGSPPHGRGTQPRPRFRVRVRGLTPAWAGNTSSGEHTEKNGRGSPPHGRGTHEPRPELPEITRLTPAWAGNTGPILASAACCEAHPRMGGEHSTNRPSSVVLPGSPPHGRGTPRRARRARHPPRLTPAWAGNTPIRTSPRRRPSGSPPHGRGTRVHVPVDGDVLGLTPAWAGNTASCLAPRSGGGAHPRMGGEHVWRPRTAHLLAGSPPHGRGTRPAPSGADRRPGLTPAWAGNTAGAGRGRYRPRAHPRMGGEHPERSGREAATPAHPRMGGEHRHAWPADASLEGSPPHGRGTPSGDSGP